MQFSFQTSAEIDNIFSRLKDHVEKQSLFCTKYLYLGVKIVRIQCYTSQIVPFLEQQLSYVLRDDAEQFDETIVVWHEENLKDLIFSLSDKFNPQKNMRLRVEMICNGRQYPSIQVNHASLPVLHVSENFECLEIYDRKNHFCYYGVNNFEPEEFIKQGHLFVQILHILLKDNYLSLSHGAVIGANGNGVLLCARGQRGKSTLCVRSLLNGFDYVSDDYQILRQNEEHLFAYPIYSIITLSPKMYHEMYHIFDGKFCCNNARKDKYVFNIAAYHSQFKTNYPIRLCLFPEIVSEPHPRIQKCSSEEKGRAIVQFIHSTVMQMRDICDATVIKKLFNMVYALPFYKINLSPCLAENTQCLKQFLSTFSEEKSDSSPLGKILLDITFDLATFLDTETFTFYSLNKFATNVYQMLCSGVLPQEITRLLTPLLEKNPSLLKEFETFLMILEKKGFLNSFNISQKPTLNLHFATECYFRLSVMKFTQPQPTELINLKEKL